MGESLKDATTQEYKPITSLGGVGQVAGDKFKENGFNSAYNLVGQ